MIDETRGSPQEMLVKQHFESTSEEWQSIYSGEDLHSRILQHRLHLVIRFLDSRGLKAGCKAIDLGCGAGLLSAQMVRRGLHVTAVDVSEAMLTLARKNCQVVSSGGHAEFVVSSADPGHGQGGRHQLPDLSPGRRQGAALRGLRRRRAGPLRGCCGRGEAARRVRYEVRTQEPGHRRCA